MRTTLVTFSHLSPLVILPQNQSGVARKPACRRTPNFLLDLRIGIGIGIAIGIGASFVREHETLRGERLLPRIARPGQVTLVPPGAPQAAILI